MADGENDARAAGAAQLGEQNFKKGTAGDRRHGLGNAVEPRRQPRAESAGENDGFHAVIYAFAARWQRWPQLLRGKVPALHEQAEDVFESQVRLLDVHGDFGGHAQAVVAERRHFAACFSGQADGDDAHGRGTARGRAACWASCRRWKWRGRCHPAGRGLQSGGRRGARNHSRWQTAVRMEVFVVRATARMAGRSSTRRQTNSAARCCASAALPPLPATISLPAG